MPTKKTPSTKTPTRKTAAAKTAVKKTATKKTATKKVAARKTPTKKAASPKTATKAASTTKKATTSRKTAAKTKAVATVSREPLATNEGVQSLEAAAALSAVAASEQPLELEHEEVTVAMLVQEPGTVYVAWSLPASTLSVDAGPMLRLLRAEERSVIKEIAVLAPKGRWYFHVDRDATAAGLVVEIGAYGAGHRFEVLASRTLPRGVRFTVAASAAEDRWRVSDEQFRRFLTDAGWQAADDGASDLIEHWREGGPSSASQLGASGLENAESSQALLRKAQAYSGALVLNSSSGDLPRRR